MATIEYTREARCLDCKYYIPAPKWVKLSICKLKNKPTNRRNLVCKDSLNIKSEKEKFRKAMEE